MATTPAEYPRPCLISSTICRGPCRACSVTAGSDDPLLYPLVLELAAELEDRALLGGYDLDGAGRLVWRDD